MIEKRLQEKILNSQKVKEVLESFIKSSFQKPTDIENFDDKGEIVLTGEIFKKIETGIVEVYDEETKSTYTVKISWREFRGGGGGIVPESKLGADGIIELVVNENGKEKKKSLLFQAKKNWENINKNNRLYEQCAKMLPFLGAAIVVNYTKDEIETYNVEDVFSEKGEKPKKKKTLESTLSSDFLECMIGSVGMYYKDKKLYWFDENEEYVYIDFIVNGKLEMKVDKVVREITCDKISNHKLINKYFYFINYFRDKDELEKIRKEFYENFDTEKHLSLPEKQRATLAKIVRDFDSRYESQMEETIKEKYGVFKSKLYHAKDKEELKIIHTDFYFYFHPDRHTSFPQKVQNILEERLKELADLYEKIKTKHNKNAST